MFDKKIYTQKEVDSLTVELTLRFNENWLRQQTMDREEYNRRHASHLEQLVSLRKSLTELQGDYNSLYTRYTVLKETTQCQKDS